MSLRNRNGSNEICSPLDARLVTPTLGGTQDCPVADIHRLTRAEVAALPPDMHPQ